MRTELVNGNWSLHITLTIFSDIIPLNVDILVVLNVHVAFSRVPFSDTDNPFYLSFFFSLTAHVRQSKLLLKMRGNLICVCVTNLLKFSLIPINLSLAKLIFQVLKRPIIPKWDEPFSEMSPKQDLNHLCVNPVSNSSTLGF